MKFKHWLVAVLLLGSLSAMAQPGVSSIRGKRTLWIPKLDLFWTGVVIAEDFPTFFPLELEVNIPNRRISLEFIVSPWVRSFNSQTTNTTETSLIGGFGLRYYLKAGEVTTAAKGFFLEPQIFYRWQRTSVDPLVSDIKTVTTESDIGLMGAVGYQHIFWDKLFLQGRVSVGYTDTEILSSFRAGSLAILPWVGLGFRVN